jgi:hypothetical protein
VGNGEVGRECGQAISWLVNGVLSDASSSGVASIFPAAPQQGQGQARAQLGHQHGNLAAVAETRQVGHGNAQGIEQAEKHPPVIVVIASFIASRLRLGPARAGQVDG